MDIIKSELIRISNCDGHGELPCQVNLRIWNNQSVFILLSDATMYVNAITLFG